MSMTNKSSLWIPYILYLLFRFAHFLLEVPTVRMIEHAVCHQQFNISRLASLDEAACNTAMVHEEVARIVGWKISFDAIPGLVSAIYHGEVADKQGHRFVLTLCCTGYLLALFWVLMTCYFHDIIPITVIWVSSLFMLIGGGPFVFAAVTAALVADLVEASSRTRYLFLLAAMPHFDKLISPPIAMMLMTRNIFLPSIMSIGIVFFCIALLRIAKNPNKAYMAIPNESCQSSEPLLNSNDQTHRRTRPDRVSWVTDPTNIRGNIPAEASSPAYNTYASAFRLSALHRLKKLTIRLRREPILVFCYLAFFLKSNAMASEAFIFQYLSERFGWLLRETPILRIALSFGAVLTTLVIAPLASSVLVRRGVPTPKIDLGIIRISLLVLTVCFIFAWRANSSTVFILSMLGAGFCEGLDPALQGLVSAVARTQETGRLFGFIYMCSLLGDMTGGPFMSALMSIGRNASSASAGYCFLASSIIFGAMGALAYMARV